jgi:hypothetical protein
MTVDAAKALKIVFLGGAALDGLATVALLCPPLWPYVWGTPIAPGPGSAIAVGYAASLMAGWTALLAWCSRAPLERAFVALLTAVPVVAGLIASELYATLVTGALATRTFPLVAAQCVLVLVVVWSYFAARRLRQGGAGDETHL